MAVSGWLISCARVEAISPERRQARGHLEPLFLPAGQFLRALAVGYVGRDVQHDGAPIDPADGTRRQQVPASRHGVLHLLLGAARGCGRCLAGSTVAPAPLDVAHIAQAAPERFLAMMVHEEKSARLGVRHVDRRIEARQHRHEPLVGVRQRGLQPVEQERETEPRDHPDERFPVAVEPMRVAVGRVDIDHQPGGHCGD